MTKAIVYHADGKVTGVEYIEPNMLEAFRIGLAGQDAVNFDRACKVLGVETVQSFTSSVKRLSEDDALKAYATKSGKAFLLVEPGKLPPGEQEAWIVDGSGKISAGA